MPRFYIDADLSVGQSLTLPEQVARHINVLRLKPSEFCTLFNGNGFAYTAQLLTINKRHIEAIIIEQSAIEPSPKLNIILIQSISSGERMDFTLQKSVELGVSEIWPISSERSIVRVTGERADKKIARWQNIVISACEQCGRNTIPLVRPIQHFSDSLTQIPSNYTKLLLSLNHANRLANLPEATHACLLIGPEGGWTHPEEKEAINAGFQSITLGPRILRTETASLAALAAMQTLWGDF